MNTFSAPSLPAFPKSAVRRNLLNWFAANQRPLPWRQTHNWYPVFLSEFLLQQTQVEQALPYYQKFIARFPDIFSLAAAEEQEALSLWNGLGYYSRARNILRSASIIVQKFNGLFPTNYASALALPGIGPYTAAAVLSIAFNRPFVVIDGNVIRALTRLFAISEDIRQIHVKKQLQRIGTRLLLRKQPGVFNEALMELGALVCKPHNPLCRQYPLKRMCLARKQNLTGSLPYKSPPAPKKQLKHLVFVINHQKHYYIQQRAEKGLLAKLWEFPYLEVKNFDLNTQEVQKLFKEAYQTTCRLERETSLFKHQYSHIRLTYRAFSCRIKNRNSNRFSQGKWLQAKKIYEWPVHIAHKKIFDLLGRQYDKPNEK